MGMGIIGIVIALLAVVILFKIIKFGLKIVLFFILALVLSITVWICVAQPDMHDPFSINTIEYLLKFNKDGSMTTTKQVTETVIQK